jgi:hypothetical protein
MTRAPGSESQRKRCRIMTMGLKARIQNGLLVAEAPPGYEEGEVVSIEIVDDDFMASLTAEEREDLERSIAEGERDIEEGRVVPASQVLEELAAKRR